MIDDFEIVRYTSDLKGQVIQLQTALWSSRPALNAAYFDWKYEANPYVEEPLIYLAMQRGVVIGMRGFFGIALEGGQAGQALRGLYADDTVVAPAHRGCGVMTRVMQVAIADLAARGHENLFNLSAGPATLHSSLQMGWCSAGWMRPMRRKSLLTRLRRRMPRLAGSLRWPQRAPLPPGGAPDPASLDGLDLRRIGAATRPYPQVTVATLPRCAEMAVLAQQGARPGKLRHRRDATYFGWRFANPLSRYRFIYWDDGGLQGYLVLQDYTSDLADRDLVNIVDWEARTPAVQAALLEVATALVPGRVLTSWSAGLPLPTIDLLRNSGFRADCEPLAAEAVPSLIMRPLRAVLAADAFNILGMNALDLANWDLRMLFSMLG